MEEEKRPNDFKFRTFIGRFQATSWPAVKGLSMERIGKQWSWVRLEDGKTLRNLNFDGLQSSNNKGIAYSDCAKRAIKLLNFGVVKVYFLTGQQHPGYVRHVRTLIFLSWFSVTEQNQQTRELISARNTTRVYITILCFLTLWDWMRTRVYISRNPLYYYLLLLYSNSVFWHSDWMRTRLYITILCSDTQTGCGPDCI